MKNALTILFTLVVVLFYATQINAAEKYTVPVKAYQASQTQIDTCVKTRHVTH